MTENRKIVSLAEFRLTNEEAIVLGDELYALLGMLCFATNEINIFMQLFLGPSLEPSDRLIKKKWQIQKLAIARVMNAKIFEAVFALKGYKKTLERAEATEALRVFDALTEEIENLTSESGYAISKKLRDGTTNHYSPQKLRQRLSHISPEADKTMLLHHTSGDSFYPIGEDVVFQSALQEIAGSLAIKPDEVLGIWMDWSVKGTALVAKFFGELSVSIVTDFFPEKYAREFKPYVEADLVASFRKRPLSLFSTEDIREPFAEDPLKKSKLERSTET